MELQTLYQHPITKQLIEVDNKIIPLLLHENSADVLCLAFRNNSRFILSNITIGVTGVSQHVSLSSALPTDGVIPVDGDFSAGVSHSYTTNDVLKELYPDEMFRLYIKTDKENNVGIDFDDFSLDLAYITSFISIQDLIAYFEFSEEPGATTISSSYPSLSGTVSPYSITGNGMCFFRDIYKTASFNISANLTEFSFYANVIVDIAESDVKIFEAGNIEIGITNGRKPYVKYDSEVIVYDKILNDYYESFTIGFSATNSEDAILTINGSIVTPEDEASESHSVSITGNAVLGGFTGFIFDALVYNTQKFLPFHHEVFTKIGR